MCGIAGFLDARIHSPDRLEEIAWNMAQALSHRGPDDSGVWVEPTSGLAFGHTRLAVVDLSPTGAQPMSSSDGRWVLNFNGEIYNHVELRKSLERRGTRLRGSSDTEVLVEQVARFGVLDALGSARGMFALAVWDRSERTLWLSRDRLGEKPLYIGWMGKTFVFGSELKALRAHPDFRGHIDTEALAAYFRSGYVPTPLSIYQGVSKVEPGHVLKVPKNAGPGDVQQAPYWSAMEAALDGLANPLVISDDEAVSLLDEHIQQSAAMQMVADVPVGAFLSGGIDSSVVTSAMQRQSARPVRTFTVGFTNDFFDEAPYAREIARHLGTDHTELYVDGAEARDVISRLPAIYDEPFADSSQIPTYLVARLARTSVTVSISGDGGDELFGGYDRFHFDQRLGRYLRLLPARTRRHLSRSIRRIRPETWNRLGRLIALPGTARLRVTGDRMRKLAQAFELDDADSAYIALSSVWPDPTNLVVDGREPVTTLTKPSGWLECSDVLQRFLLLDLTTYLPDDLLTKVDRAAMAVSLETRLPLLDHRLVEFVWRLPLDLKVRNGEPKWLLKKVLDRYVPRPLFERPKQGFSVPLAEWLRGPLREWAGDLLSQHVLRTEGYLREDLVTKLWADHLSGEVDASHQLWAVLMFQAWLHAQSDEVRVPT